jgi:hypothetical protein
MARGRMEWAIYTNDSGERIEKYYEDLDKEEYESKYKNHLTCINGCRARTKFTQKKNGSKFYSNWNGDGEKHDKGCPFSVEYKGKIGRDKLKAYYEKRPITDEDIKKSLLNKINGLKRKYRGEDSIKVNTGSNQVERKGETSVTTDDKEGVKGESTSVGTRREHNITSIDASFLSTAYVRATKCVYGIGNNAQIVQNEGNYFGYINLKNRGYNVAVYFPEAFYSDGHVNIDDFRRLFKILISELNDNHKKNVIVCYGEIRRKEKNGININIINDTHILINDMSIRQILSKGKLKEIDYEIV